MELRSRTNRSERASDCHGAGVAAEDLTAEEEATLAADLAAFNAADTDAIIGLHA